MELRTEIPRMERQLQQTEAQLTHHTREKHRLEGALMLARAWVAEEDALPKLLDV